MASVTVPAMNHERTITTYVLVYQPAEGGDPDTAPILERSFVSWEEAARWVDDHFVVPVRFDTLTQVVADGRVLATTREPGDFE